MHGPTRSIDLRFTSLAAALLLALAACGEPDAVGSIDPVVRDSAGVAVHEFPAALLERAAPLQPADTPRVRIGVVTGAPEYQWTRPVAATRLSDGAFAVVDRAVGEIRLFDAAGAFLARIGRSGDGPGEFDAPVGLTALPGDTLLVWDEGARRASWFTRAGALVRDRTLRQPGEIRSLRRVALSPGGGVLALGAPTTPDELGNQGRVRERWSVVPVGPDGEAAASIGTVPGTERAIDIQRSGAGEILSMQVRGRWWWGEGFAWPSPDGVWTADRLAFEARHFDPTRGLDRIVRVAAPDRPFTPTLIDSLHRVDLERVADEAVRERLRIDMRERDYPEAMPPVAGVFADAAGRVWIGRTEPPPERLPSGEWTAIRRWVVFREAADGGVEGLGVVILPPRSHPLYADDEGVLLVRVDPEFDVPYVQHHPWVEPRR